MAITPVQPNIEYNTTYRDSKKPIKTDNLVHPHPAEGHLVHDSLLSIPKFWMKDMAYDLKAVRDGFSGKAKDHQTGRLNDVGLKLGGIGIATYLASQTTDPKMRVMEYVGLGTFLACMSLYPMIAINAPSRLIQGFDIGKEYIDDQGRKKSVFQDGNYIPYDMYKGEYAGEDLDVIGDRMGIPRNIKNRHELIKEQMRKIAIQNNTLWMLGAGFATPVMTALLCSGIEQLLSPSMEFIRNKKYNSKIADMLKETQEMTLDVNGIVSNSLNKKVKSFLSGYVNKEFPKEKFEKLVKMLSSETDDNLTTGIKEDLEKLLKSEKQAFVLGNNFADDINEIIKTSSTGRKKATFEEVFKLSRSEIATAVAESGASSNYMNAEQLDKFKTELKKLFEAKIKSSPETNKDFLYMQEYNIIDNISKHIKKTPSSFISENGYKDILNFARVLGDFKENDKILDKCKSAKVEHSPETMLARSYKKFENAIFSALDIRFSDLKQMKESETFTKEIIEKKIQALVSNEVKYQKTVEKLAKIMSETEIRLHGESETESHIKNLISAYENNYNNTAKRINNIGEGKFANTIHRLIKDDVNSPLENTIKSRNDLFNIIDGIKEPFKATISEQENYGENKIQNAKELSKGVGSSKRMAITRIIDRIQGVENSQRRMLHTLDVFKRSVPEDEYAKHLNSALKNILLQATSADHTLKLNTENNPKYYQDLMAEGWTKPLQESTKRGMEATGDITKGNIYDRFNKYLKRFRDVLGQSDTDFKKPGHRFGEGIKGLYGADSNTLMQKFNLVAQNPIDFFKKAAKTRFENQKWLRIALGIGGTVIAATVLAQFGFGKIKNPHNIQKQVNDDTIG